MTVVYSDNTDWNMVNPIKWQIWIYISVYFPESSPKGPGINDTLLNNETLRWR
jgi:hypothetical protein